MFYRIRVAGAVNIPMTKGVLLVSNHVSLVDPLLLMASTKRPICFLMEKGYYENPVLRPFAQRLGCIPVSAEMEPRALVRSLKEARQRIKAGEVVCIFAEGQITRTGRMLPFRRGLETIMKDADAPIIPVRLDGLWGSIFSFDGGRFVWKLPERIPYPVAIHFGRPMSSSSSAADVRVAVQGLDIALESATIPIEQQRRRQSGPGGFAGDLDSRDGEPAQPRCEIYEHEKMQPGRSW
jgi:acyl-[acyl-carrier-protein]-phospholipid O-acyltransferase/long-chain-fatty-acid--[acyl-carrier-protein] ligase